MDLGTDLIHHLLRAEASVHGFDQVEACVLSWQELRVREKLNQVAYLADSPPQLRLVAVLLDERLLLRLAFVELGHFDPDVLLRVQISIVKAINTK